MRLFFFSISLFIVLAPGVAGAADRVALLIANTRYEHLNSLPNPVRDVRAVARLLKKSGFEVTTLTNLDSDRLQRGLSKFRQASRGASEAIIYYAGHGMSVVHKDKLQNVIAPTDASISCENRTSSRVIAMQSLFAATRHIARRVFLFDACRNDPFKSCTKRNATAAKGFGFRMLQPQATGLAGDTASGGTKRGLGHGAGTGGRGALVMYSTDLGALASDGEAGGNSPFAATLIKEFSAAPHASVREVLEKISKRVTKLTSYSQVPWVLTRGGEPKMCLAGVDCETSEALKQLQALAQARFLADKAELALKRGDAVTGMLLALEALPKPAGKKKAGAGTKPANPKALAVLKKALGSQHERFVLKSRKPVTVIGFSPNGRLALTGDKAGAIRLWDVKTGRLRMLLRQKGAIESAEFSPDGRLLAVRSTERGLKVWDVRTGLFLYSDDPRKGGVLAVAWQPRARHRLAIASSDGNVHPRFVVRLLDVDKGSMRMITKDTDEAWFRGLLFSPDGKKLALNENDHVSLWDINRRRRLARVEIDVAGMTGESLSAFAFTPDGNFVVANIGGSFTPIGPAKVFSGRNGKLLTRVKGLGRPHVLSAAAKTRRILVVSTEKAEIWDTGAHWERRATLEGHTGIITGAVLSRAGNIAATISRDGTVRIWDAKTGKQKRLFRWGREATQTGRVAVSPGGRYILASYGDESDAKLFAIDASKALWAEQRPKTYNLPPLPSTVGNVHNGIRLVRRRIFPDIRLTSLSPNGKRVAIHSRGDLDKIIVYNLTTLKIIRKYQPEGESGLVTAHFYWSKSGQRLLVGENRMERNSRGTVGDSGSSTVRIFDFEGDGTVRVTYRSLRGNIEEVLGRGEKFAVIVAFDGGYRAVDPDRNSAIWQRRHGRIGVDTSNGVAFSVSKSNGSLSGWFVLNDVELIDAFSGNRIAYFKVSDNVAERVCDGDGWQKVTYYLDTKYNNATIACMNHVWNFDLKRKKIKYVDISKTIPYANGGVLNPSVSNEGGLMAFLLEPIESGQIDVYAPFVWDTRKDKILYRLKPPKYGFGRVELSPDGKSLVTIDTIKTKQGGLENRNLRIWDARTGVLLARIKGLTDVKFLPDGSLIWTKWTTTQSGTTLKVRTFARNDHDPVASAVSRTPRCLTPAQRRGYVLAPEPPRWCIAKRIWPYHTESWRFWQAARDAGKRLAMPSVSK